MSYLEKISENKKTASPAELSYKPVSPEIDALITTGALVHMLEFQEELIKYTENFCNALAGKATGAYSSYRDGVVEEGSPVNFSEATGVLQALPTSAIRKGYPFTVFTLMNCVGVLIDPSEPGLDFSVVQPNGVGNRCSGNKITFINENFFNDDSFKKINLGTDGSINIIEMCQVPIYRSEADKKALRDLFEGHFWDIYADGLKPDDKEFLNTMKEKVFHNAGANKMYTDLMSEIIINTPPKAIKGIIIARAFNIEEEQKQKYEPIREDRLGGAMLAVLVNEVLQQKGAISKPLPIIQYISPSVQFDKYTSVIEGNSSYREVNVEMKKVAKVLSTDKKTFGIFKHFLSPERFQQIMLGRDISEAHKG